MSRPFSTVAEEPRGKDAAAGDESSPEGPDAEARGDECRARRLLVVSHPAVVSVNQEVYKELARRGWGLTLLVPSRWRHDYARQALVPVALPGLESCLRPTRVVLAGRPQRHLYVTRPGALLRRVDPDVAFVEEESFSLPAAQWGFALARRGIPFGVQCYENIDRPLPRPVGWLRSRVLRDAAFVAARSRTAGELARAWGARGEIGLAPPAVPTWERLPERGRLSEHGRREAFTVGYAGRLVASKGLADLLAAVRQLEAPVELVLIGDGEMRRELEGQPVPGSAVRVLDGLTHERMPEGYAQLDVLVLPSRTTASWKEQFGRVIVEALWCGVPVIGSDSGEIPWLVELTGGGLTFPEGDVAALARELARLREEPRLREELSSKGRAAVERLFTVTAAADALERLLAAAASRRRRARKGPRAR